MVVVGGALKEASVPAKGDKMQLVREHLQARPMPHEMEPRLVCVKELVRTRLTPQHEVLKPTEKKRKKRRECLFFFFFFFMSDELWLKRFFMKGLISMYVSKKYRQ